MDGPLLTPAVLDRVDPKREMGAVERTIAGLCALLRFHLNRGEPEKVTRVAGALLYAYRSYRPMYATIADAALKHGEIAAAALKNYANMPDGRDLQLSTDAKGRVIASVTNKATGQLVSKQILSPQELGARFIGGVLPEHFEKLIADLAGEELNEQDTTTRRSTPRARSKDDPKLSTGTGFFVTSEGHALTNAHVVEGCQTLSVRTAQTDKMSARIVAQNRDDDLALLRIVSSETRAIPLRLSPAPRVGEQIVVYGFPMSGLLTSAGNATTGNISGLAGIRDRDSWLQITAPVQPGNSGGPLLDMYANVVGIVVAKLDALRIASAMDDIPQNVNFAIKASLIKEFLDAKNIQYSTAGTAWRELSAPVRKSKRGLHRDHLPALVGRP
jgi:S1-C subfamily serine protease